MKISGINFGSLTNKPAALKLNLSERAKAYVSEASKTQTNAPIEDSFIISSEARQKLQAYQNEIKSADNMAYKAKEKSLADANAPVQLAKYMSQEAPMPAKPGKVAELRQKFTSNTQVAEKSSYQEGAESGVQNLIDNGAPVQLAKFMNQKAEMPQKPVAPTSNNFANKLPEEEISGFPKGNEAVA